MTISENIARIMKDRSITQKQLSTIAEIPPTTLNTWLVDNYESIPSRYILPICAALSVDPLELLAGPTLKVHTNTFAKLTDTEMRLLRAYRSLGSEEE